MPGARDLQQRRQRALHAVELEQRRCDELVRFFRKASSQLGFFEAHAHAIQRRAQVVSDAVERSAQRGGLLLDAIEHGIDSDCERIEFIE